MKKIYVTLFMIGFLTSQIKCQKNALIGTLGIYSSVSFERTILETENEHIKWLASIHGGKILDFNAVYTTKENRVVGINTSCLLGKNGHYLESVFGVFRYYTNRENEGYKPDMIFLGGDTYIKQFNIGYRAQSDRFIFRVGGGFPELGYYSLGLRF